MQYQTTLYKYCPAHSIGSYCTTRFYRKPNLSYLYKIGKVGFSVKYCGEITPNDLVFDLPP